MGRFWKAAGGGAAGRAAVADGGLLPVIVPGVEPATAELAAGAAASGEDDGGGEGAIVLTDRFVLACAALLPVYAVSSLRPTTKATAPRLSTLGSSQCHSRRRVVPSRPQL